MFPFNAARTVTQRSKRVFSGQGLAEGRARKAREAPDPVSPSFRAPALKSYLRENSPFCRRREGIADHALHALYPPTREETP